MQFVSPANLKFLLTFLDGGIIIENGSKVNIFLREIDNDYKAPETSI